MKKVICLFLFIVLSYSVIFSQHRIFIRYVDNMIETPIKIQGYLFSTWKFKEFEIKDSLFYAYMKQRIDSMILCNDISCPSPDVRQQIIVVNGEKHDILSSDGSLAMEKNGKNVEFDKSLQ